MEFKSTASWELLLLCWSLAAIAVAAVRWHLQGRRGTGEKTLKEGTLDLSSTVESSRECCCACNTAGTVTMSNIGKEACCKQREVKKILVAYATQSNTAYKLSNKLVALLSVALREKEAVHPAGGSLAAASAGTCCSQGAAMSSVSTPEIKLLQLKEEDGQCSSEHLLESGDYGLVVFLVSTHTGGNAPEPSQGFASMLKDAYQDFRFSRDTFARMNFAIFGLGDVAYGPERFNRFAKDLYMWCKGLGAKFIVPPVYANESNITSLFHVFSSALLKWISRADFTTQGVVVKRKVAHKAQVLKKQHTKMSSGEEEEAEESCHAAKGAALDGNEEPVGGGCHDKKASDKTQKRRKDGNSSTEEDDDDDEFSSDNNEGDSSADDVEDIVADGDSLLSTSNDGEPPELLYPRLRENLERQGYHLIGSHSGVKLCRWTKAMLRGRGGCYKHTFYNIASYQCMEMTPSLACANKCVFCWRHHTNPVGRSFRWKVDSPRKLIEGGLTGHRQMVKQMRGVPGVTPERLKEAHTVRHCALSLVGEPIMYPEINGFVDLLHEQNISSFMVTNAQFPEQLRQLKPVTQLYLSIDAPTPEELQRIDRPLFEDYWERCLACVRELRRKAQRTVFRLTLVNKYNTANVAAYADLVRLGWPDFIEVKGVTYCGTSSTSTLTMKENVPRHTEVVEFCEALCEQLASCTEPKDKRLWFQRDIVEEQRSADRSEDAAALGSAAQGPYRIACEHEHSCCVLIALRRFYFDGVWHTWIDYDKFLELARSGRQDFTAAEYAAPTPSWAVFRSEEKGFDPSQVRVRRKSGKTAVITSGC